MPVIFGRYKQGYHWVKIKSWEKCTLLMTGMSNTQVSRSSRLMCNCTWKCDEFGTFTMHSKIRHNPGTGSDLGNKQDTSHVHWPWDCSCLYYSLKHVLGILLCPVIIDLFILHVVYWEIFTVNCICYKNDPCSPESKSWLLNRTYASILPGGYLVKY